MIPLPIPLSPNGTPRTNERFAVASRARAWDNGQTEYSGDHREYHALRPLPGCTPGEGSLAFRGTDGMPDLAPRLWSKVTISGQCWTWTGATTHNGYGQLVYRASGRQIAVRASRLAWELVCGPIPAGMLVCHTCDNRRCVRPDHLWLGTPSDNTRDMVAKGRARKSVGVVAFRRQGLDAS